MQSAMGRNQGGVGWDSAEASEPHLSALITLSLIQTGEFAQLVPFTDPLTASEPTTPGLLSSVLLFFPCISHHENVCIYLFSCGDLKMLRPDT